MATELLINIVSQATGKGFLESEKAVNKLEKKVKSLGKTLGVSLAAGAALKFSKTFIKAFAEDEKAAVRLNRAVENLGIGFANPSITKFIADLERTSAIADDVLRPAFQNLLSTTGSLTKSQELLNKAITISRGTGIDLATVTDDLTKAYLGQTKGLSKYKTGLTSAELATKSFSEIVGIILTANLGAAEDYLDTTAFKMDVLTLATGNAQEIIGGGLVDALGSFAGSGEASDAQFVIEQLSTGFANLLKLGGTVLGFLARIPEFGFTAVGLGEMYERPKPKPKTEDAFTIKQKELLAKLEKAAVDRAKKLAELAKKQANAEILKRKEKERQAKLDKAALALGKGEGVFDLDKIQIQAALLAKQDEINKLGTAATDQQKLQLANEVTRLSIKETMLKLEDAIAAAQAATTEKEKELAIAEATRLANKLNMDTAILGVLQKQDFTVKSINAIIDEFKPKNLINIQNLNDAYALLLKMAGLQLGNLGIGGPSTGPITGPSTGPITGPSTTDDDAAAKLAASEAAAAAAQAAAAAAAAAEARAKAELEAALAKSAAEREAAAAALAKAEAEAAAAKAAIAAAEAAAAAAALLAKSVSKLPPNAIISTDSAAAEIAAKTASNIETLTELRADTPIGTAFSVLLKEQIDTLTDALSSNVLSVLGDEQARLQAMGIFDTVGIGAGSTFDPASFRMRDEGITITIVDKTSGLIEVVQNAVIENTRYGNALTYTGNVQAI